MFVWDFFQVDFVQFQIQPENFTWRITSRLRGTMGPQAHYCAISRHQAIIIVRINRNYEYSLISGKVNPEIFIPVQM